MYLCLFSVTHKCVEFVNFSNDNKLVLLIGIDFDVLWITISWSQP